MSRRGCRNWPKVYPERGWRVAGARDLRWRRDERLLDCALPVHGEIPRYARDKRSMTQFGMIGLGVMGANLALNIEEHGFSVAVWNREPEKTRHFIAKHAQKKFTLTTTLAELVGALQRPRRIMMMIKAEAPVDETLDKLLPLLEPGDVVIDGGNSWFKDTQLRAARLIEHDLHFVRSGVSGGEDGARFGPSLMPGGTRESWESIREIFEAIAARSDSGPCVTYCGPD